jgi:GT2 family glycosyltransferase
LKNAVVILNWNGINFLKQFLPGLVKNSADSETGIFVADNNSSDDSVEYLSTHFPDITIIRLNNNYGFAGGYNMALEKIDAEYYTLVNSDIEVTPGWLNNLILFLDNHAEYAACQPKILSWHKRNEFEYAGAAGGYIDKYGYPFCRGRIFGRTEADLGQYNNDTDVFWTSGACMVIRSDAWRKAGGFDDSFFAHMEEIDLCWRLLNSGYKLKCIPKSEVYHVGGGALPYESPFKTYLNFRNNLMMLYKNLPDKGFRKTLFIRKVLDGVAAGQFLLRGKVKNFLSVFHAHVYYYRNLKSLKKKRSEINFHLSGKPEIRSLILNKSIVFEFYVRKKDSFDKINFHSGN